MDQLPEEAGEGENAREVKLVDLKTMKGWWPVYSQKKGVRELAGGLCTARRRESGSSM